MSKTTVIVRTEIYTNSDLRNWLAVRDCLLSPTGLGGLQIVFPSDTAKLEFCLQWADYVISEHQVRDQRQ